MWGERSGKPGQKWKDDRKKNKARAWERENQQTRERERVCQQALWRKKKEREWGEFGKWSGRKESARIGCGGNTDEQNWRCEKWS